MKKNFYCQKVVGDVNFSIDEWNKQYKICQDAGMDMGTCFDSQEPCENQCFECIAIVGQRQIKTKNLQLKSNIMKPETNYQDAFTVVKNELLSDQSDGSMYYAWQSNIAMSMIDAALQNGEKISHEVANKAAKHFLWLLTKD